MNSIFFDLNTQRTRYEISYWYVLDWESGHIPGVCKKDKAHMEFMFRGLSKD